MVFYIIFLFMNSGQRYKGAIALILSQTNYTEDEAEGKIRKMG